MYEFVSYKLFISLFEKQHQLRVTAHQGSANKTTMQFHPCKLTWLSSQNPKMINACEDMRNKLLLIHCWQAHNLNTMLNPYLLNLKLDFKSQGQS